MSALLLFAVGASMAAAGMAAAALGLAVQNRRHLRLFMEWSEKGRYLKPRSPEAQARNNARFTEHEAFLRPMRARVQSRLEMPESQRELLR